MAAAGTGSPATWQACVELLPPSFECPVAAAFGSELRDASVLSLLSASQRQNFKMIISFKKSSFS